MEDPLLKGTLDGMRDSLVRTLETTPVDTPQSKDAEDEICRTLRTLRRFRDSLESLIRAQNLRERAEQQKTNGTRETRR